MRMAINKTAIAIAFAGLLSSSANAWMEDWAPAFNCTPAAAEKLSETNVSNFVSKVRFEKDSYWQCCEGYKLDLNGDGIKDFVYILPWRGSGLGGMGITRISGSPPEQMDGQIRSLMDSTSLRKTW